MQETMRVERARHRLTQGDLAKAIGVTKQTVHAIESGKNKTPSVKIAMKIAMFFGISVEQLIEG